MSAAFLIAGTVALLPLLGQLHSAAALGLLVVWGVAYGAVRRARRRTSCAAHRTRPRP
ncbi:hypothetical protein ACU686_37925 [Yinghuangia aomiensis]